MSTKFLKIGGDYKISTESGGRITLDTGNEIGDVVITGDLVVQGQSTVVETTNMTIEDNIIINQRILLTYSSAYLSAYLFFVSKSGLIAISFLLSSRRGPIAFFDTTLGSMFSLSTWRSFDRS